MNNDKILIVDDEPDIRELLEITLLRMGLDSISAANVHQARQALNEHKFRLCLTDMNLGDGNGIEVIDYIQQNWPELPVAMITAYSNMETAIEAMKAGAFDYVAKPIDLPKLRALVQSALKIQEREYDLQGISSGKLLGNSSALQALRGKISKLARSLAPVYIHGESGSGKELAARMIHQQSARSAQPFIAVNCGAIPSELMESEFFGHEKGSFTGANEKKHGLFKAAEGGTLFLDEVADLPKDMQVKLLRAIQEKSIRPIGANHEIAVDVRILSATHKNLAQEVMNGSFRQDLFYRINVIELPVPSLRERPEDIPDLAGYFLQRLSERYEMNKASLSSAASKVLQQYDFPGNVRELENILERAYALCEANTIDVHDLQLSSSFNDKDITGSGVGSQQSQDNLLQQAKGDFTGFMENMEKTILSQALEQTRWNKTAAADLLGISFRTMRYKLKKLGID